MNTSIRKVKTAASVGYAFAAGSPNFVAALTALACSGVPLGNLLAASAK